MLREGHAGLGRLWREPPPANQSVTFHNSRTNTEATIDPDTPTTDDDIRDAHGRYRPGHTGNPLDRPVGSRRVLHLARALAEAGVVAVVLDPRRPARPTSPSARRPRGIAA